MEELLNKKVKEIINLTINDERWNLQDETMFQVFGFTISGFSFGVGRNLCFMESEAIGKCIVSELTKLGAGEKYVEGLVMAAFDTFEHQNKSFQSNLVGVGYSHFASEDLIELKNSIFLNTQIIEQSRKTDK